MFLDRLRRRSAKAESIDFTDYKAPPMDFVNCFEKSRPIIAKRRVNGRHASDRKRTGNFGILHERMETLRSCQTSGFELKRYGLQKTPHSL